MRLVLALVAALLFAAAYACADPVPEIVDEADVLRVQLAESRADSLATKIETAKRDLADLQKQADALRAALQQKYKLAEGDQVDPTTRAIKRAPKAAPKKDVKK